MLLTEISKNILELIFFFYLHAVNLKRNSQRINNSFTCILILDGETKTNYFERVQVQAHDSN